LRIRGHVAVDEAKYADGAPMATVRHKHQENRSDEIVEKGDIFFAYRPGIEQSEPKD
jgi:hypothetical protein